MIDFFFFFFLALEKQVIQLKLIKYCFSFTASFDVRFLWLIFVAFALKN